MYIYLVIPTKNGRSLKKTTQSYYLIVLRALLSYFSAKDILSCQLTKSPFLRPINAKKYAIRVGVPIFTTPHTLRHSYATDLLSQGVDLRIIQEFLGHRSITSTQIYTHVTNKRLRDIHRQFHRGKNLKG